MIERFEVGNVVMGGDSMTLIAGPCLAESYDLCARVCEAVASASQRYGFQYIFKASFDKANRTSVASHRGAGIDEGLKILSQIKATFGVPVTTDVHLPDQAWRVAECVDLLQVPAFLCRQSDILEACSATGKPVNVKKGQFLAPHDALNIVDKLRAFHAKGIMLTERGTTFGYNALVVDMPGMEIMRSFGIPVCFDATHSAQRPGGAGATSGGNRDSIPALSRAAVAVGVDAVFMEVHPDPAHAASDRETQWPLGRIDEILAPLARIRQAIG